MTHMRKVVTVVTMRSQCRSGVTRHLVAHNLRRSLARAATDSLDEERSPISTGEGMHNFMTRITVALFEYVKDLVSRAHIASITEWPMHREW